MPIRLSSLAVASALLLSPATRAAAQATPAPPLDFATTSAALDAQFAAAARKGGSFVVRYELDQEVMARGYGHLDCGRTQAMSAEALVDSGSITKDFTRAAVYKLVEAGRLKLDDRLGELLGPMPADRAGITVAQLLGGTSGFPDYVVRDERTGALSSGDGAGIPLEQYDYAPLSKAEFLARARAVPLAFAPGTKEAYSNFAFQLLAAIIERASRLDYEHYVRDAVLLPAGMTSTGYRLADWSGRTFADQCRAGKSFGDPVSRGFWRQGVSWNLVGAGGMMTTAKDLTRWLKAVESGSIFRHDIGVRFARQYYRPAVRCGGEAAFKAGSNELTLTETASIPRRKLRLVVVSTRSDHHADMQAVVDRLCPRVAPR